jgi:hypothetical protein
MGSQASVPANMGDRLTVDLGITQSHEAPPLVVDLDGTLTTRGTIPECLRWLARERPWWLPRLLVSLVHPSTRLLTRARTSGRVGHVCD